MKTILSDNKIHKIGREQIHYYSFGIFDRCSAVSFPEGSEPECARLRVSGVFLYREDNNRWEMFLGLALPTINVPWLVGGATSGAWLVPLLPLCPYTNRQVGFLVSCSGKSNTCFQLTGGVSGGSARVI